MDVLADMTVDTYVTLLSDAAYEKTICFSILVGLSGEMMALERANDLPQCVKELRYPALPVS